MFEASTTLPHHDVNQRLATRLASRADIGLEVWLIVELGAGATEKMSFPHMDGYELLKDVSSSLLLVN